VAVLDAYVVGKRWMTCYDTTRSRKGAQLTSSVMAQDPGERRGAEWAGGGVSAYATGTDS
jgi:hypothetical protein